MKFMLNEQELEEHLTKEMVAPTEAQPLRDHTAYQKWNQKDRSARYTLLSSLQNDLIGQYDELPTCKALWEQLKFSFGGTSTTRLRSLVIKFEEYTKDPKHTMSEHLRVMSNMIGKLRDAGHALTDEQQVRAVIRSLPASWANMKHILTHSENIKNFFDVSQHVILEAETRDADKTLTYVAQVGSRNANEEVEPTLPSPSEGGELVPHPVVTEDSVSDLQPSGSIPDSGSTPQGPLGQQDSQLRRGFEMIEQDHCVYVKRSKKNILILSLYVDDILLAGNDMSSIVATKQWLSSTFEMKDIGEANYVLGVKIGADRDKHISTSGGAISWCSKKKSCIALSTMESEYVACLAAVQEAVWLRSFLQSLGVTAHADEAVTVHCDNTAALDFVKDPKYHGKAKHIGLRYHFIRTLVAQGEVSMKHIPTGRMVADPLTKPIARDVFLSHIRSMGLRRHYESDWAEKLRLCHEEDTQCRYFSMYPWIMDDAVSRGMSRKAVGSNWNDMRALGRKFNITPCCVIHSPGDFVDFRFDMSHEYITYERFNTAHYEGFESV
ncbi:hypothetical protein RJ640_001581 [Escallonia rubra]|uniref:Reverse transcriptase Ty1/copia-type domain-containing protein n=1 Tax=Escallonia rubra TaxID=112253 RepID=A0AA88RN45_9ASTE|nr:hypothetical protein RJ640_001581 [Escallonia rubra]